MAYSYSSSTSMAALLAFTLPIPSSSHPRCRRDVFFLSNVLDLLTDPTMMSYRTAMSLSLKRSHHKILLRHALWLLRGCGSKLIATVSMAMYAASLIPQRIALAFHSTPAGCRHSSHDSYPPTQPFLLLLLARPR